MRKLLIFLVIWMFLAACSPTEEDLSPQKSQWVKIVNAEMTISRRCGGSSGLQTQPTASKTFSRKELREKDIVPTVDCGKENSDDWVDKRYYLVVEEVNGSEFHVDMTKNVNKWQKATIGKWCRFDAKSDDLVLRTCRNRIDNLD